MCGGVHDVITGNKFHQNRLRGFRVTGVQKSGTPIDLACRPYNSSALPCWLWCYHLFVSREIIDNMYCICSKRNGTPCAVL